MSYLIGTTLRLGIKCGLAVLTVLLERVMIMIGDDLSSGPVPGRGRRRRGAGRGGLWPQLLRRPGRSLIFLNHSAGKTGAAPI